MSTALAEYAKLVDSDMERSYRRSIYCADQLEQVNGRLKAKYCGNRWCLVCAAIRTARAWDGYQPIIETREWRNKQFVTLTRRNVSAAELRDEIGAMMKDLTRAKESMKKTDRCPLVALRKLECTYNAARDDFHPHFHLIVQSRQMARLLVARWLELCGERADEKAQDVRPASKSSLAELFKYFTKIVTKQKMTPTPALDTIFTAMKGRRVYQPMGFTRDNDDDEDGEIELDEGTSAPTRRDEVITWEWIQGFSDWVDRSTGDCLTDYEPGARFRQFVDGIHSA